MFQLLAHALGNAVIGAPFPPGLEPLDRDLAALPADTPLGSLPSASALAACAAYLASRHALNREYTGEIARATGLPVVPLRYLAGGIGGAAELQILGDALLGEPRPPEAVP